MARNHRLDMLGLRSKILLGFGGLLLIVLAVSLLGRTVLDRYSGAMQRVFKEDYQSVAVCEDMDHAVDHVDTAIQQHFWGGEAIDRAGLDHWRDVFDQRLARQRAAATLPGEREATERLAARWTEYRALYPRLLDPGVPKAERQAEYARAGLPGAMAVQQAAHDLIDMNMGSMLSVHDRVREMASRARTSLDTLTVCAVVLALAYAVLLGRFILQPVRAVTDSVRRIEGGNLDLRVDVRSRDELGTLAGAVNAMADRLKAYRQAEHERLVRTERTTQLAIDSLPDAVVVLDPTGRIELANQTARQLFDLLPGASVADAPGTRWLADLHRQILRTGAAPLPALSGYDATIQVEDEDGQTRAFLPRAVPIRSDAGQAIGATVVLADVTGLRRLDETKNGLLSLVSHELKTPLTSMRMVLHLVTDERVGPLSPRQRDLLGAAREDAERLHTIIESLLDMARIESGRALMEPQPVAPLALATTAADSQRGAFASQGVELAVEVPADLPYVAADATRIGHVLNNLLHNALRHTPAGGHVRVWAARTRDGAEGDGPIEMGVSDDGPGIPRQHLGRVFEKFFRAPGQAGGSAAGSGLGLSLAREIVEAHGGRIRAESVEGAGATIAFTLPRAERALTPTVQEPALAEV